MSKSRRPTPSILAALALALSACGLHAAASAAGPTATMPEASTRAPAGLSLPWTPARCADARGDLDRDGLDDGCELALARAFAPLLVVTEGGCNWAAAGTPARLGGGYLFAVQRAGGAHRVAYLPAYFRDCGWTGIKCWLPGVDCAPHAGDSEAIVVELVHDAASGR